MIPYHQIATRFYNRPLLLAPSNAQAISGFLYSRIATELAPRAEVNHAPRVSEFVGSSRGSDGRSLPYKLTAGGVGIITIVGELVNRGAWVGADSGLVSYEGIKYQCAIAESDPDVKVAVIDMECPGGEAIGCFDAAAAIRRLAAVKPVIGVVNGLAASGGYALLSGATRIITIDEGLSGSIGVVMVHFDFSAFLANEGVKPTLIFAGARKVDGNPFEPLPEGVRAGLQSEVEQMYGMFISCVSAGRPALTDTAIRATEAGMFFGTDALKLGLVDEVSTFESVIDRLTNSNDPLAAFAVSGSKQSVHAPRVTYKVQEGTTMEPCKTCGAEECQCGDKCTAKACGCCDPCKATGAAESGSGGESQPSATAEEKSFFAMVRGFFAGSPRPPASAAADPEKAALIGQLAAERTARVNAEVGAVLERNAAKLGRDGRVNAESLLRAAMTDPQACAKTLGVDLVKLLDSLPVPIAGVDQRARRSEKPDRDAELAMERASASLVGDDAEGAENVAVDREVRAYMTDQKMEYTPGNYRTALAAVRAKKSAAA